MCFTLDIKLPLKYKAPQIQFCIFVLHVYELVWNEITLKLDRSSEYNVLTYSLTFFVLTAL